MGERRRSFTRLAALAMAVLGSAAAVSCTASKVEPGGSPSGRAEPTTAAPPFPRAGSTPADRARWRAVLQWPGDCEQAFQASRAGDDAGLTFHVIAAGTSIVQVQCAAGSYQPSFVYIRLIDRAPSHISTVLHFPVYQSLDGTSVQATAASEIWGESALSVAAGELAVLNLARQTRDCGVWTRYDIRSEAPVVLDARIRFPCPVPPDSPVTTTPDEPPAAWRPARAAKGSTR